MKIMKMKIEEMKICSQLHFFTYESINTCRNFVFAF